MNEEESRNKFEEQLAGALTSFRTARVGDHRVYSKRETAVAWLAFIRGLSVAGAEWQAERERLLSCLNDYAGVRDAYGEYSADATFSAIAGSILTARKDRP